MNHVPTQLAIMFHGQERLILLVVVFFISVWLRKLFVRKIDPEEVTMERTMIRRTIHSVHSKEVVAERLSEFEANTMYTIRKVSGDFCVISQPASPLTLETFYVLELREAATGTDLTFGIYRQGWLWSNRRPGRDMNRLSKALQKYI